MKKLVIITAKTNEEFVLRERSYQATNKPFTRQKIIFDELSNRYSDALIVENMESLDFIKNEIALCPFITDYYLVFLENAYKSYIESGVNNPDYISPYDNGLVNYLFSKSACEINSLNIPYYLQCGMFGNDYCTSIFDYTYETALRTAHNGILASKYIEKDTIVYCCNVLPGHHAAENLYGGYCFINNAAVCTFKLLKRHNKISILDIDYHHGDGTQTIFYNDPRIQTISIHGNPINNYPFYTGFANENVEINGVSYNQNYPLESKSSVQSYIDTLIEALNKINDFNPDILIIAFGADTYQLDPQGSFDLNLGDYTIIGKMIRKIQKPIIITQEGGYDLEFVGKIVSNFIKGLIE
jgi:acetoin utilization deacetylase AcuC-like enzyme